MIVCWMVTRDSSVTRDRVRDSEYPSLDSLDTRPGDGGGDLVLAGVR